MIPYLHVPSPATDTPLVSLPSCTFSQLIHRLKTNAGYIHVTNVFRHRHYAEKRRSAISVFNGSFERTKDDRAFIFLKQVLTGYKVKKSLYLSRLGEELGFLLPATNPL